MNCSRSLMEAQYVVPCSNLPSLSWLHLKCKQKQSRGLLSDSGQFSLVRRHWLLAYLDPVLSPLPDSRERKQWLVLTCTPSRSGLGATHYTLSLTHLKPLPFVGS